MKLSVLFKKMVPKKLFDKLDKEEIEILNKKFLSISELVGILFVSYFVLLALAIVAMVTEWIIVVFVMAIVLLYTLIVHAKKEERKEEAETLIISLALKKGMVKELVKEIKDNEKNKLR